MATQDIGKGRYQYYAFLARDPGSAETEEKPDGTVPFLKKTFEGWSPDIHAILDATREDEIEQRDLYDRPPSSLKPWSVGPVGLLGDSVHAMMPNLGQGGCQAIEDAIVLAEELKGLKSRTAADVAHELPESKARAKCSGAGPVEVRIGHYYPRLRHAGKNCRRAA